MQTQPTNHRYNGWRESAKLVTHTKTVSTDLKRIWYKLKLAGMNLDDNLLTILTALVQSAEADYAGIVSSARMQVARMIEVAKQTEHNTYIGPPPDTEAGTVVNPGLNTISNAAFSAKDGDVLIIQPGDYEQTEQIKVNGKSITFRPMGKVAVDCTTVSTASMEFRNSASVVEGSENSFIQIGVTKRDGTVKVGSGGRHYGVVVYGQKSAEEWVELNFLRVISNSPDSTYAAIRSGNTNDMPTSNVTLNDCMVKSVGQDGFSAFGEGYTVDPEDPEYVIPEAKMTCTRCKAIGTGEDGFTAHGFSTMVTEDCEASDGKTGFAPAFGCTWTSTDDYLHDNYKPDRQCNLYLVGNPNFNATGLRLGGTTTYHIRVKAQVSDRGLGSNTAASCTIDGMVVDGVASSWLAFQTASAPDATGELELSFTDCQFGGQISAHGIDDVGASETSPVVLNFSDGCVLNMSRAGGYIYASRASKGTVHNIDDCSLTNASTAGHGIYCDGHIHVHGNTIVAGSVSGVGVAKSGYNHDSGSNSISAEYPYKYDAEKQTGDTAIDT